MPLSDKSMLVSTDWLAERLDVPDIRIVDVSMHLPDANRDARAEYEDSHLPGAVFLDLAELTSGASNPGRKLPASEKFASRVRKQGIGDGNFIVLYDKSDLKSACRGWWMLHYFGHTEVAVLDGGFDKWAAEDKPLTTALPTPRDRHFTPRVNAFVLRELDQMRAIAERGHEQIIDARAAARFEGSAPEPRPNMRAGHMPGAKNIPYKTLLEEDGTFKPADELRALFEGHGIDLGKPAVTTCGSGVTAGVLAFALELVGARQVSVYDGSWSEWGGRSDTPVETGPVT